MQQPRDCVGIRRRIQVSYFQLRVHLRTIFLLICALPSHALTLVFISVRGGGCILKESPLPPNVTLHPLFDVSKAEALNKSSRDNKRVSRRANRTRLLEPGFQRRTRTHARALVALMVDG